MLIQSQKQTEPVIKLDLATKKKWTWKLLKISLVAGVALAALGIAFMQTTQPILGAALLSLALPTIVSLPGTFLYLNRMPSESGNSLSRCWAPISDK